MATKKGFLDLPLKVRNHIYSDIVYDIFINDPHHAAAMKRPGAVDRWKGNLKKGFYNDEIFQSPSAIIAANRLIHCEFYPILKQYIDIAPAVTVHILDLNFNHVIEWINSWSQQEWKRHRVGRECTIQLLFDFERFTPLKMTLLKEWLAAVTHLHLAITCAVVMQYPQHQWWVGHGFQYPAWVKKYCDFVEEFAEPMFGLLREAIDSNARLDAELCGYYGNLFYALVGPLGDRYRRTEKEKDWWSAEDLEGYYFRVSMGDVEGWV